MILALFLNFSASKKKDFASKKKDYPLGWYMLSPYGPPPQGTMPEDPNSTFPPQLHCNKRRLKLLFKGVQGGVQALHPSSPSHPLLSKHQLGLPEHRTIARLQHLRSLRANRGLPLCFHQVPNGALVPIGGLKTKCKTQHSPAPATMSPANPHRNCTALQRQYHPRPPPLTLALVLLHGPEG